VATVSGAPSVPVLQRPGRRFDHVFFPAMAVILTATMVVGFARTYFLAGLFRAPLPNILIHIHGVVFTCWFLLLLAQASLTAMHRVDLHRRLGIAGVAVAVAMLPLGILATAEYTVREVAQPWVALAAVMPLTEIAIFSVLAAAAFFQRRRPDLHKRLILLATIALIAAAVGRMEFLPYWHFHGINAIRLVWAYTYVFLVPLAAYDLWSTRRLNPATAWGSVFMISLHQMSLWVATTAPWRAFVHWMQSWSI
jgi:hypothetical protein